MCCPTIHASVRVPREGRLSMMGDPKAGDVLE